MTVVEAYVDYGSLRLVAGRPGDELVLVPRDQLTDLLDEVDALRASLVELRRAPVDSDPVEPAPKRRRPAKAQ